MASTTWMRISSLRHGRLAEPDSHSGWGMTARPRVMSRRRRCIKCPTRVGAMTASSTDKKPSGTRAAGVLGLACSVSSMMNILAAVGSWARNDRSGGEEERSSVQVLTATRRGRPKSLAQAMLDATWMATIFVPPVHQPFEGATRMSGDPRADCRIGHTSNCS